MRLGVFLMARLRWIPARLFGVLILRYNLFYALSPFGGGPRGRKLIRSNPFIWNTPTALDSVPSA
jgi:hypothetical protein